MGRSKDWLRQTKFALSTANTLRDNEKLSWTCYAAHQAAEKPLKALLDKQNLPPWGNDLVDLLERIKQLFSVPQIVTEAYS